MDIINSKNSGYPKYNKNINKVQNNWSLQGSLLGHINTPLLFK